MWKEIIFPCRTNPEPMINMEQKIQKEGGIDAEEVRAHNEGLNRQGAYSKSPLQGWTLSTGEFTEP